MNTVLMGTIISKSRFPHKALRDIIECLDIQCVFVFEICGKNQFLLTYNIDKQLIGTKLSELTKKYENTIRLHRKKEKNVFFTIGAIVELEKSKQINWDLYNNCLLLKSKESKEIDPLEISLAKIINLKGNKKYEKICTKSRGNESKTRKK